MRVRITWLRNKIPDSGFGRTSNAGEYDGNYITTTLFSTSKHYYYYLQTSVVRIDRKEKRHSVRRRNIRSIVVGNSSEKNYIQTRLRRSPAGTCIRRYNTPMTSTTTMPIATTAYYIKPARIRDLSSWAKLYCVKTGAVRRNRVILLYCYCTSPPRDL